MIKSGFFYLYKNPVNVWVCHMMLYWKNIGIQEFS